MFGRKKPKSLGNPYPDLRARVLNFGPTELGLAVPGDSETAFVALMEMGLESAVVTLVCCADKSTSLYFSNGGGIIGGGGHATVASACLAFIEASMGFKESMAVQSEIPPPNTGDVRFVVRSLDAKRTVVAKDEDLSNLRSALSPLYAAGQEVITQLRLTME